MPPSNETSLERRRIHVDGVVQGVGFRPFIYGLATRYALTGWVLNSSAGVDLEAQGTPEALDAFQRAITAEAPRLARIDRVTAEPLPVQRGEMAFAIQRSEARQGISLISPDVATCPDCLAEVLNPADRRYRYPFTNCTNCGPRYTIIQEMPYDRPMTTMRGFEMCPACRAEYENPLDRRFHAQPNACPVCGPQVRLVVDQEIPVSALGDANDDVARAAALLRAGFIVAVKGMGGFHLACDATDPEAVARLRERKTRPHKPFAVMMTSLEEVRRYCQVSDSEAALLDSPAAPIALLYRGASCDPDISTNVAPDNPMIGVMLPYTPLHHLLMRDAGRPLVMTSGNRSEMPVIKDDDEALEKLAGIADAFLLHNRPIHMRCDDAVWWADAPAGETRLAPLRRSRGDAPYPVRLPWRAETHLLATGAEMKNTLCLLRDDSAFVSQHIGEVDSLESLDYFRAALDHLARLFKVEPQVIAHDLHPGYLTTRLARDLAAERDLPLIAVQHHHAHIAACLAEHGRSDPVIGIAFDGTGYGPDGTIWGGEALLADVKAYRRLAFLEPLPLPGGDAAIRRPYRIAWAYLLAALGDIPDLPGLRAYGGMEQRVVMRQVQERLNTPLTSSAGRLFDAVSALLGICPAATFEAQAAIALELAAREADPTETDSYPFEIDANGAIRLGGLIKAVAADALRGRDRRDVAAAFHRTAARMIVEAAVWARQREGLATVALSGGVFQNRLLLGLARDGLARAGFEALTHQRVPANDGGLSLGQAVIAHHQTLI